MRAKQIFAGILISSMLLSTGSGCSKKAKTTSNISTIEQSGSGNAIYELSSAKSSKDKSKDMDLDHAYLEFALGLIRRCAQKAGKENFMVSPDSVLFALGMTAAGADGETLDQMLGALLPGMDKEEAFLFAVDRMDQIESKQLHIGNSIWINDSYKPSVYSNYLKYVEQKFGAQINSIPFNNSGTDQINSWVDINTNGMIPKMVDHLSADQVMILINALAFDAKWEDKFKSNDVTEDRFHADSFSTAETATFLWGEGDVTYLSNQTAQGFYKTYKGGKYAFMTILPYDYDIDINEYVANMTADDYMCFWYNTYHPETKYCFPEFTAEYSTSLNETLKDMGMADAFNSDTANFGNMADIHPLFISEVIQSTKIEVDADGTKASAATKVTMEHNGPGGATGKKEVKCNRPFAYAIVDVETGLPIFFGTVEHVT